MSSQSSRTNRYARKKLPLLSPESQNSSWWKEVFVFNDEVEVVKREWWRRREKRKWLSPARWFYRLRVLALIGWSLRFRTFLSTRRYQVIESSISNYLVPSISWLYDIKRKSGCIGRFTKNDIWASICILSTRHPFIHVWFLTSKSPANDSQRPSQEQVLPSHRQ